MPILRNSGEQPSEFSPARTRPSSRCELRLPSVPSMKTLDRKSRTMSVPHRPCWSCLRYSRCHRRGGGDSQAQDESAPNGFGNRISPLMSATAASRGSRVVCEDAQPHFGHQGRREAARPRPPGAGGRSAAKDGVRQGQQRRKTSQRRRNRADTARFRRFQVSCIS